MSTIFLFLLLEFQQKRPIASYHKTLFLKKYAYIYIVEYYVKYIENIIKNYFTNDTIKSTI